MMFRTRFDCGDKVFAIDQKTRYPSLPCPACTGRGIKEAYMLEETGVGSGRVWAVDELFASEDEALARLEEDQT